MNNMPAILSHDGISVERLEYVKLETLIERRQQNLDWFPTFNATVWDHQSLSYIVHSEDSNTILGYVKSTYINGSYEYTSSLSGKTYGDRFGMIRAIYDCYQ